MKTIDLNSDMGEMPEAVFNGAQESLISSLTSVNIACGGHAGEVHTMKATVEQALRAGVAIGAHPSYPDRENFGRVEMNLSPAAIADSVFEQVRTLGEIAASCSARVTHVKVHGALYNQAARDTSIAGAIAAGVARWSRSAVMVGLAGSAMLGVFRDAGFSVAAEAFADRRYEPDGSLRARKYDDALIQDPAAAAQQALRLVERSAVIACDGSEVPVHAQTLCIHSDTPGAPRIAAAVAKALRGAGVALRAISA
jgi:5-oxoprolinase (ATP-hydrolysing) subunit A